MTDIRFSRKETRQLAAEATAAGFTYIDDDTKGHARFLHQGPCNEHDTPLCEHRRCTLSLAETPAVGQIKRVRDTIARVTGNRRGGYNAAAARGRAAAQRDRDNADQAKRLAGLQAAIQQRAAEQRAATRARTEAAAYRDHRATAALMGMSRYSASLV